MAIKEKDIKLLWGRAASRCSLCKVELSQNKIAGGNYSIGEQAHIVAETESGPRGHSILSEDERNSYDNLILLCPNHHTIIDKDPSEYPIEKLHRIKSQHELWVQETLSNVDNSKMKANELIYANLIDNIVQACQLYNWDSWSSFAISNSNINWPGSLTDAAFELRRTIIRAAYPGTFTELEHAMQTVSIAFNAVINIFDEHCIKEEDNWAEDKFYHLDRWDTELYDKLLQKYKEWRKTYFKMFYEFTKSLNWFSDIVRRDINPLFFAKEGKFILTPFNGFTVNVYLLEFTDEEKCAMPDMILNMTEQIDKKLNNEL